MKLVNQEIDMISWTSKEGIVTPVRFRIQEKDESIVIKVGRILHMEQISFGGTPTLQYRCSSMINGIEKVFELSCNCGNQKWLLTKI